MMVECFAPDGELHVVGGETHRGLNALQEFFAGVRATTTAPTELTLLRHCVTNTLIDVLSPATATANSYFQVLTNLGLDHWGRYRDTFAPDPHTGRWLIASRSVKTDAYAPNSLFSNRT